MERSSSMCIRNYEMRLVDLFSGCGGFSLGAHQAGFGVVAAIDNDPVLSSSYLRNFPDTKFMLRDISKLEGDVVREIVGHVDGIIGGPPCQGFSTIGKRSSSDQRRSLLRHFFRFVGEINPVFFVMENVCGLAYTDTLHVLDSALSLVEDNYSILGPKIWNASDFGAATKRPRLFVIGIHKHKGDALSLKDIELQKQKPATVKAAISDMKNAVEVGVEDGFDVWEIKRKGRPSNYAKMLRGSNKHFTGHRMTHHSLRVVNRFNEIPQGGFDSIGRHPRLSWSSQCPTLRAGTGPDKGSFQSTRPIHPDDPRVITVREAARLQGFPDGYLFHPTIWHSFRMIGNSVSPMIATAILKALSNHLDPVVR